MSMKSGVTYSPSTNEGDEEALHFAMQLILMGNVPRALNTTLRLGLLEVLSETGKPMPAMDIIHHIPAKNPEAASTMVDRMLSLLATYGVVTCSLGELTHGKPLRLYSITPLSKFLVKNDGVSLANLGFFHWDEAIARGWNQLPDTILEGGVPFNKANCGKSVFEYMSENLNLSMSFNQAMWDVTCIIHRKIIGAYDGFKGLGTLVDVGGGTGGMLNFIISKYPTIKGINLDLPHVIAEAPSYPGIEHVGGDMFKCIPKGDAILMKFISHGWGDEDFSKVLISSYDVLPENGKVILIDLILPQLPDTSNDIKFAVLFDCSMMIQTAGGKERTLEEFKQLAKGTGFKGFRLITKFCGVGLMELLKKESA